MMSNPFLLRLCVRTLFDSLQFFFLTFFFCKPLVVKLLSFGESLDNHITKMHLDGLSKDLKVERIEELFTQPNKFCPSDQAVYDKVALNRTELRLCLFNVAAFSHQEISISASNGIFLPLEFPMP